jgi:hypothetical protein
MKVYAALLVIVSLGAVGCSGAKTKFYWCHPGGTLDQAKADYEECAAQAQEDAEKITEQEYFERMRSPVVLSGDEEAIKQRKKPKKSEDPASLARDEWRDLYKQNAFSGCMVSRGYIQLRDYQVPENLKTKKLPLGAIAGRKSE